MVTGEELPIGQLRAANIHRAKTSYVAGASEVFLSGTVSEKDRLTSFVTIGDVSVYLADASATNGLEVNVGDTLEIAGSQAQPLGPIWARDFQVTKSVLGTQGIQGTGTQVIQGTGVLGIQGTGTQAIQGTGVLAIQGTGVHATQEMGTQAIQGTGALAF